MLKKIKYYENDLSENYLINMTWSISNIIKNSKKNFAPFLKIKHSFNFFFKIIQKITTIEALNDSLSIFAYYSGFFKNLIILNFPIKNI